MDQETSGVRRHLVTALRGGLAYDSFDGIVGEVQAEERFTIPPGGERSVWQILEHMRIALQDIIDFTDNVDGSYSERAWPEEYWPTTDGDWDSTVEGFKTGMSHFESIVLDDSRDLLEPFPWGDGQTLLRQAILVIDHNAHHLGQILELTRWLKG